MRKEIDGFFRRYRDAHNGGDAAAIARHIAVPSILQERAVTVWTTEAEVLASMERLVAFYRRSGFKSANFVVNGLMAQGPNNAATDIAWTIERHAKPPWRFHAGYNMRRVDDAWRIVVCTADEEQAARSPG